jgi:hypothetical protein
MQRGKKRAANRMRWRAILEEQQRSGQKLEVFARRHGLNPAQLTRWKVKFASEREVERGRFVDVAVVSEQRPGLEVTLRIRNNLVLELSAPPAVEWLAALARSLS